MAYKHGIYTESVATVGKLQARSTGTIPVYIGTAKTNTATNTNVPVLVNSYSDFVEKFGWDADWAKYTLCEVAYAHFKNNIQTIAPFVVINMGKEASAVVEDDFTNALEAIDLTNIKCGVVPNIICAPSFSHTYASELIAKCEAGINEKWGCVAYIDMPTETVTTIDGTTNGAIAYKTAQTWNSKYARVHFPRAKYNGLVFHLSVLDAVTTQIVDNETDGVACRSSSNRRIICDTPVLVSGTTVTEFYYTEKDANKLNENGITTINYVGGAFRLWGGHCANYNYSNIANIEAKDRSDATIRMQIYLDNWLKREHIDAVDTPISRRDIDNIVADVNIGLNAMVNSGYLLKGECYFDASNNPTGELADGNLVLDVLHTEVPNGKSISFQLAYDVSGLETLYEVEEA